MRQAPLPTTAGQRRFRNGIAEVCGTKGCGYIDRTGRVIWPRE